MTRMSITSTRRLGVPLLACLAAGAAQAQHHAQQATSAAAPASVPAVAPRDAAAAPTRHRSSFGDAMARLTGALRDAGKQPVTAQAPTSVAATPATASTQARAAQPGGAGTPGAAADARAALASDTPP